jgi:hypothetical protein
MKDVYLFRTVSSDQGTEGVLATDGFFCKTLELPWKQNKRSISCIPAGEYTVQIRKSPKYGTVYWVTNVPNRTWILIHSGNVAGDTSKGYRTHVNGCILLGKKHGFLWGQRAVLTSRPTVRRFREAMNDETFKLIIVGNQILHNDHSRILR